MNTDARAATLTGAREIGIRTYSIPSVDDGGAVLDVEVCALCGTDFMQYTGNYKPKDLEIGVIPGHEVVGVIREGHPDTLARWGVAAGDRVAIEPNLPCGMCARCVTGQYVACEGIAPAPQAFGFTPIDVAPALWGGYAEAMYLPPRTILHKVPEGTTAREASLTNVVANAFNWVCNVPQLRYGQTVVILGAGQRGLACVAAARASGAGTVITTGLSTDARRLEAARALGADEALTINNLDVVSAVRDLTGGEMADIVVDCTAGATKPVVDAINSVKVGGTVVLGGMKHGRTIDGFSSDDVVSRQIKILGALSASFDSNVQALKFLSRPEGKALAQFRTHELALDQVEDALALLGGERPDEEPIYISLGIGV